jgi:hypothetical protein
MILSTLVILLFELNNQHISFIVFHIDLFLRPISAKKRLNMKMILISKNYFLFRTDSE